MTLESLTRILWRERWRVIPVAVSVVVLCVGVVLLSPPTYRASGSVVLLNPPALPQTQIGGPSIPDDWQNPYARIGSLSVVVDLMVRVMGSDPVQAELVAAGYDGTAEIAGNRDYYTGPLVDLSSEAPTAEQAITDVNLLIDEFNTQLDRIQQQQGTVEQYRIRAETVVAPREATTVFSQTLRLLIVAIGFGACLVVGTALISDRIRSRNAGPSSDDLLENDLLADRRSVDESTSDVIGDDPDGGVIASMGERRRSRG